MDRRRRRRSHHHRRWRRHHSLAINHGLDLVLGHAGRQQALAHLVAQLALGLFLLRLFFGGFLGLLNVPALHGFRVGLFARRRRGFGRLLLFELREGVFFDDPIALGFFLFGMSDYWWGGGWYQ